MSDDAELINLVENYLDAVDSESKEDNEGLRDELDDLKGEREELVEEYGEDDILVDDIDEEIAELEESLGEVKQMKDEEEELRNEILEKISSEYIAKGDWLSSEVIEAVNHVLLGVRKETLRIEDELIKEGSEFNEKLRDVSHAVRQIAKSELEEHSKVDETWESIQGTKKEEPFEIVVQSEGKVDSKGVSKKVDEDIDTDTANNRLKSTVHQTPISPYYRDGSGNYSLSTVGEYISKKYLEVEESKGGTESEEANDEQKKLTGANDD